MGQATSSQAYISIKQSGALGKLQEQVYDVLYQHGALTQGEIWKNYFDVAQRHTVTTRVAELVKLGVVQKVGERSCAVTGRTCVIWDTTNKSSVTPKAMKEVGKKDLVASFRTDIADLLYDLTVPNDLSKDDIKARVKAIYDKVKKP